jgi:hypothetical protein
LEGYIQTLLLTADDLVAELNVLGVPFLTGRKKRSLAQLAPVDLLISLAQDEDARMQVALIPLLLVRPDYAHAAPKVVQSLPQALRLLFMCYFTAAVLLQQKYAERLRALLGDQPLLPDLFFAELGVPVEGETSVRLRTLGEQQRILSGVKLNWLATYEYAAQRLITRLEREKAWLS